MKYYTLIGAFMAIFLLFSSCKKDDDNNAESTWKIKYELESNITGEPFAQFTGNTANAPLTTIAINPDWTTEVTYPASISQVKCRIYGDAGYPGESLTLMVYRDGVLVSTTNSTVDSQGEFDFSSPVISY